MLALFQAFDPGTLPLMPCDRPECPCIRLLGLISDYFSKQGSRLRATLLSLGRVRDCFVCGSDWSGPEFSTGVRASSRSQQNCNAISIAILWVPRYSAVVVFCSDELDACLSTIAGQQTSANAWPDELGVREFAALALGFEDTHPEIEAA